MQVLPELDAEGVDLLRRLLEYNPKQRLTAAEALRHPWLADAAVEEPEQAGAEVGAPDDRASPLSDETQLRDVPDGEPPMLRYKLRPLYRLIGSLEMGTLGPNMPAE